MSEGTGALSGVSYKDTNSIMRAPPSWPNHLPKASLLYNIILGIRFQQWILRARDTNIQSIALMMFAWNKGYSLDWYEVVKFNAHT